MDYVSEYVLDPLTEFSHQSRHFITRCHKPDQKEFWMTCKATGIGFLVMGAIGYFVKLVHIPINNILMGGDQ